MATANNLRKLLHRKVWEQCAPLKGPLDAVNTVAGSWVSGDCYGLMPTNEHFYCFIGPSNIYKYNADEDAWMQIKNSGLGGTMGAGACGEFRSIGYGGTAGDLLTYSATGGTTTTLNTAKTFVKNLVGTTVEVIAGTGVGYKGTVTTNLIGANSILTVSPANAVAFDATTRFRMWSGSLWCFMPSTTATDFGVYDCATDTWNVALSVTGAPTTWGTNGQLISTGSFEGAFYTGTASAGAASTITVTNNFPVNAVANYQIKITGGTGNGQIRQIASNTVGPNSVLTVSAAWTVIPDATSTFSITGSDDYIYLLGGNVTAPYRYNCSTDTWTSLTVAPAARAAASTADWISGVTDSAWTTSNPTSLLLSGQVATKQNGRYLYCGRGATGTIDIYDIALNAWYSLSAYGNASAETLFTAGCSIADGNYIYIMYSSIGRFFRFDLVKSELQPITPMPTPSSTTVEGDKIFTATYKDGATKIKFLYAQTHSRPDLLRMVLI